MQELIFTSAPKGLRPGAKGFTTVACSRDMSPLLVERLESLSAYRFHDGAAVNDRRLHPTAYSFVTLRVGNRAHRVVSRIAPTEADYTGRSNILAHHLILEDDEIPSAGPAWLLRRADVLVDRWQGDPCYLPDRLVPQEDHPPGQCATWEQQCGDAGWAGVLAESITKQSVSACLVYPLMADAGETMLQLFDEAIALLPPNLRWRATFSTALQQTSGDVHVQWRAVSVDNPLRAAALRTSKLAIDLRKQSIVPPDLDTAASQAARRGATIPVASPEPVTRRGPLKRSVVSPGSSSAQPKAGGERGQNQLDATREVQAAGTLSEDGSWPDGNDILPDLPTSDKPRPLFSTRGLLAAGAVVCLGSLIVAGILRLMSNSAAPPEAQSVPAMVADPPSPHSDADPKPDVTATAPTGVESEAPKQALQARPKHSVDLDDQDTTTADDGGEISTGNTRDASDEATSPPAPGTGQRERPEAPTAPDWRAVPLIVIIPDSLNLTGPASRHVSLLQLDEPISVRPSQVTLGNLVCDIRSSRLPDDWHCDQPGDLPAVLLRLPDHDVITIKVQAAGDVFRVISEPHLASLEPHQAIGNLRLVFYAPDTSDIQYVLHHRSVRTDVHPCADIHARHQLIVPVPDDVDVMTISGSYDIELTPNTPVNVPVDVGVMPDSRSYDIEMTITDKKQLKISFPSYEQKLADLSEVKYEEHEDELFADIGWPPTLDRYVKLGELREEWKRKARKAKADIGKTRTNDEAAVAYRTRRAKAYSENCTAIDRYIDALRGKADEARSFCTAFERTLREMGRIEGRDRYGVPVFQLSFGFESE